MKSYHNNPALQQKALEKLQQALQENRVLQDKNDFYSNQYWKEGKGTVIGCISETGELEEIAQQWGIPQQLLKIQNHIFHFLEEKKAQQFGLDFLKAIPVGVDLEPVWKQYFIWLLAEVDHSTLEQLQHLELAKIAIEQAVATLKKMDSTPLSPEKLEGIIQNISNLRRTVGQAADAGAIQPSHAGWELAKAHWALQAILNVSFVNQFLPQGGPSALWDFLAEQLLSFLQQGKASQNTYYYD